MKNKFMFGNVDTMIELPPGFRFHPTDEELITHYLFPKVINSNFYPIAIGEVDLNKCEPWDLPWRANMGEKEWYFYCIRDRKYPTGIRTNRATEAGYWKATGKDKEILQEGKRTILGMKKTLVFYQGRAPNGVKTDWVMHEYRLEGKYSVHHLPQTATNEWVICRVFQKSPGGGKVNIPGIKRWKSCENDLPPLMDTSPTYNSETISGCTVGEIPQVTRFSDLMENLKIPEDRSHGSVISSNTSLSNSDDANQFIDVGNQLQFPDCFWIQDDFLSKTLQFSKQDLKQEFSSQDHSSSAEAVELGCLWNY